jgi:hypothetical protein
MGQQVELKTLAAHLAKVPPADVLVVRFRADGFISIVINPGKKLYFTPEQIARATAQLQAKPAPAAPPPASNVEAFETHMREAAEHEADAPQRPRGVRHSKL